MKWNASEAIPYGSVNIEERKVIIEIKDQGTENIKLKSKLEKRK